jgi:hypothetical protein
MEQEQEIRQGGGGADRETGVKGNEKEPGPNWNHMNFDRVEAVCSRVETDGRRPELAGRYQRKG